MRPRPENTQDTTSPTDDDGSSLIALAARLARTAPANDVSPAASVWQPVLARAVARRSACALRYRSADGSIEVRAVDPLALTQTRRSRLLLAYCRLRGDLRTFRLDRVEGVELLGLGPAKRHLAGFERFVLARQRD